MSTILEECSSYTIGQLNSGILPPNQEDFLSTAFLNIDGNSSNFDSFAVQMSKIDHKFSIIGLAETNTDPVNSCLFKLKDYSSCYQHRYFNKINDRFKDKGTGVCLYLHKSLNFSKIDDLSLVKENIESLFVTVTNIPEPVIAGVIYRPPNSSLSDFNIEYEKILSELKGKKAYVLGDFNVNLLNVSLTSEHQFEEVIFTFDFGFYSC